MQRYLEDLTVGDFEGMSVEAIADFLSTVKRRTPSPAVNFEIAEKAAREMLNIKED